MPRNVIPVLRNVILLGLVSLTSSAAFGSLIFSSEQLVTVDPGADRAPTLDGTNTIFTSARFGTTDLLITGADGLVQVLAGGVGNQTDPHSGNGRVVFVDTSLGDFNIGLATISTGTVENLTIDPNTDNEPDISGDTVVLVSDRLGNKDIWTLDLNTRLVSLLAATSLAESQPAIDGDLVAWQVFNGTETDVMAARLGSTAFIISDTAEFEAAPAVSGDRIAYIIGGDVEVFDTVTGVYTTVTNDAFAASFVTIYGDVVSWQDDRNGNLDIFAYDMADGLEYQVTSDPSDQRLSDLGADRLVFYDDRLGDDNVWSVDYAINIDDLPVPEPSTLGLLGAGLLGLVFTRRKQAS